MHVRRIRPCIVSCSLDTYAHTTQCALLKGRLTTTAITPLPCGAGAACSCPGVGQAVATERDEWRRRSRHWPSPAVHTAAGYSVTHLCPRGWFGQCWRQTPHA